MSGKLYIKNFVRIKNRNVNKNGSVQTFEAATAKEFAEKIYRSENLEYPKFFKMDTLSKFGFLAAELVLKGTTADPHTSLVFANVSASLDTDILYAAKTEKTGKDFQPSPALFVYTLPNIVMGEVCIRHKIQGETIFFVLPKFDALALQTAVNTQFSLGKATSFMLAWVDILQEDFDIFACFLNTEISTNSASESEEKMEFCDTILKWIYNGTNITATEKRFD